MATTFWVGEVFDPEAADGSQVISAYEGWRYERSGGCDGVIEDGVCQTEPRSAENGFFPSSMTPKQTPFYLDLPFADVNNVAAFALRGQTPLAQDPGYAGDLENREFSCKKNRWVQLQYKGNTCSAQIQDAGPAEYDEFDYVFGDGGTGPKGTKHNDAELNGTQAGVSWRFVDEVDVPDGPWKTIVTDSGYDWTRGGPADKQVRRGAGSRSSCLGRRPAGQ